MDYGVGPKGLVRVIDASDECWFMVLGMTWIERTRATIDDENGKVIFLWGGNLYSFKMEVPQMEDLEIAPLRLVEG